MAETATQQSNCPPLSLADRLKIYAAQYLSGSQGSGGGSQGGTTSEGDVQDTTGLGIDVPVESSDYFRWRAFSSNTNVQVTFYGRIRQKSGTIVPFSHTIDAPSGGAIQTKVVSTGAGILIGAAASVPVNSFSSGSVNAVGEIGRMSGSTFTPHHLLFSGQLDDMTPLSSQVSQPTTTTNRTNFKFISIVTNQAVPHSENVTPTTGYRFRMTRVGFTYTCSGTAGTRQVQLLVRQSGNTFQSVTFPLTRTAGQIGNYEATISGSNATAGNSTSQPLAQDLYFYDTVEIFIWDTAGISGSDVLNPIYIRWEES